MSKLIAFQLSALTTATTRTITFADRDIDLSAPTFDSLTINPDNDDPADDSAYLTMKGDGTAAGAQDAKGGTIRFLVGDNDLLAGYLQGAVKNGGGTFIVFDDEILDTSNFQTTAAIQFSTDTGNFKIKGDLTIGDQIKGARCLLGMGEALAYTASRYLDFYNGQQATGTLGYRMPRAGSIVGASVTCKCTGHVSDAVWNIEVHKNGTVVFPSASATIAGTGDKKWGSTQARGTDTFVAGDVLSLYMNEVSGDVSLSDTCAIMELVFDT
jgi:hypothetical protein